MLNFIIFLLYRSYKESGQDSDFAYIFLPNNNNTSSSILELLVEKQALNTLAMVLFRLLRKTFFGHLNQISELEINFINLSNLLLTLNSK